MKRMLVFASIPCLELLAKCAVWSFDGTFDSSPRQFAQLFTIHGFVHSIQMPLVFALLENKDSVTYTQLILNLKELAAEYILELNPIQILSDLETAAVSRFNHSFELYCIRRLLVSFSIGLKEVHSKGGIFLCASRRFWTS